MEAVSTSTAGFVGMAMRGPVIGKPQLVTSFADYQRTYGGYLSEAKYGDKRFLPYAVEQFFLNGGARAFIMRVAPEDAKPATATVGRLSFTAANPGLWGEAIRILVEPASKARTQVFDKVADNALKVKSCDGFNPGDVVELFDGKASTTRANKVTATVAARVVNVMPDGLLQVEGARETKVNNETQYLVVSGLIRSRDVAADNSIMSTQMADAQIAYYGKGVVSDKQKPGWFTRLMDHVWPF